MSFLDSVADLASSAWSQISGDGVGAGLAKAATLALMLRELQNSMNKDNKNSSGSTGTSYADIKGTRQQLQPDTNTPIPVVYGDAYVGGKVFDAQITADKQTMYFALALCEKTGDLLSTGRASVIELGNIYWDNNLVKLDSLNTLLSLTDDEGEVNEAPMGLVTIYYYVGGSAYPQNVIDNDADPSALLPAWQIMPGWTTEHTADDLVFVIIKMTYNAEKGVTGLGDWQFQIRNSMRQPGDCLLDFMTNKRYGAGIPVSEINI